VKNKTNRRANIQKTKSLARADCLLAKARAQGKKIVTEMRAKYPSPPDVPTSTLKRVLAALEGNSDTKFVWLHTQHKELDGKSPIEMLAAGEIERVLLEARTFLKHGS
jgi:hypothetical protein